MTFFFIAVGLALPAATTPCHTVLKFGKSPTGDVVSTGNDRNGFIIVEGPVAPMSPGNARPTALHPLPGNRETESLNDRIKISDYPIDLKELFT